MPGERESAIHDDLVRAFAPVELQVVNESSGHNVPAGSESHFKVVVVSEEFEGMSLVKRHRAVNGALQAHLDAGMHALAIHAYTPAQYEARGGVVPESPPCLGGSKHG